MTDRKTGLIKFYNKDKGYGFIYHNDGTKDIFFHRSQLKTSNNLEEDQVVTYEVGQNNQGPAAFNVILNEVRPERAQEINTLKRSKQAVILPNPYTFVPVVLSTQKGEKTKSKNNLFEVPGHDGGYTEERITGELHIRLRTLTPMLVGARRVTLKNPPEQYRDKKGSSRNLLEPWRLSDGRVVIPGSSIKGMLRHYIAALLNSPMERVEEQYYSYRPNLSMNGYPKPYKDSNGDYTIEMRESIIQDVNSDDIKIKVLESGRQSLFVQNEIMDSNETLNLGQQVCAKQVINNAYRSIKKRKGKEIRDKNGKTKYDYKLISGSSKWHADDDYKVLRYHGGMDREGKMAKLHGSPAHTYGHVFTRKHAIENALEAKLDCNAIDEYKRTYSELQNQYHGHLSKRHPKIKEAEEDNKKIDIPNLLPIQPGQPLFEPDTLIFTEVMMRKDENGKDYVEKVLSFGHHFHYRWAYRDSIHIVDRPQKARRRPELSLLEEEYVNNNNGKLAASRALFGYNGEKNVYGDKFIKHYSRLAGRISINHALEDCDKDKATEDTRFMYGGDHFVLKELGSPKASAVEFYIKQNPDTNGNALKTYGDLAKDNDSELAGRKFYRHQPDAAKEPSVYKADTDDEIRNHRATIVRYASEPGTEYKFTLRFVDLDPIELGAVLFVLGIHRADHFLKDKHKSSAECDSQPKYALKIGYARPLGWGSVITEVEEAKVIKPMLDNDSCSFDILKDELLTNWSSALIQDFIDNVDDIAPCLQTCLSAWNYADQTAAQYPIRENEIYNFHTNIRRNHAEARRTTNFNGNTEVFTRKVQTKGCES